MRESKLILLLILFSCTSPKQDKIVVPELHAGFYSNALDQINDKLKSDPNNTRLVDQKLFYCEQLGWPTTCISALDTYKQLYGMTNQLVKQYITYYQRHERYQLLLEVFDKWNEEYGLKKEYTKTYIDCLSRTGNRKRAFNELRQYLIDHQSTDDFVFASTQYLRLQDTALAALNLSKLYKKGTQNELMWEYGNILFELGYQEFGFEVLDDFVKSNPTNESMQLTYARLLEEANRNHEARAAIKPFSERDTIAYLLADWYLKDQMWDSAGLILEKVIEKDSSKRKPIWKAARLYEDRGWFSYSMSYYEHLIEMNPTDTLAAQRIDLIQRKIAYLQRLKFEENKIPIIELQPKKIEN